MKTFQLEGTPRTDLGKKAVKALRKQNLIPAVLNGGQLVTLPYDNALKAGEKVVEIANNQALIVTDFHCIYRICTKISLYSRNFRYRSDYR